MSSNARSPITARGRRLDTDLDRAVTSLSVALADLDPGSLALGEVTGLFELFTKARGLAGNGQTLLARRVEEARDWAKAGYPSAEEWIAAKAGTSVGDAKDRLRTSDQLRSCGATADAMRTGAVSPEKAGIVADAAVVNPDAEDDLLRTARRESNKNLRDEAARRKAQGRGEDPNQKAKRHHRERKARAWTDRDGKRHLHVEGPVAKLAGFEARWEREIDRRYRAAATAGKREGRDAYAFDAFLALTAGVVEGEPKRTDPQHLALIRVDLTALVRGDVRDEEVCEVPGVGTVSVPEVRDLLGDSVLKLVCENGVDVQNVTHLGRGPNAVQKLALLWSSQQCTVVGCHRTHTEYDHRIDYAETEHTRVDETDKLCDFHHDLKTYQGWALVTGNGKRDFVGPDDPRHPNNAKPTAEAGSLASLRERAAAITTTGTPLSAELAERARRAFAAARTPTDIPRTADIPGSADRTAQGDLFDLLE